MKLDLIDPTANRDDRANEAWLTQVMAHDATIEEWTTMVWAMQTA